MGLPYKSTEQSLRYQDRLQRTEKMMRRGIHTPRAIAARLGVCEESAKRYVAVVMERWVAAAPATARLRRAARIAQLEEIMQESLSAWEKSKEDQNERSVVTRPCPTCAGAGNDPDEPPCKTCGGVGTMQTISVKVSGSPGDPAYLNVAKDCVVQAAKLEGLGHHPRRKALEVQVSGNVGHAHVQVDLTPALANCKAEDLLAAMAALAKLQAPVDRSSNITVEGRVVSEE